MRANIGSICPVNAVKITPDQCAVPAKTHRILWMCALALGLLLVSGVQLQAAPRGNNGDTETIDRRWLPWVGSWRLVANTINTANREVKGEYRLDISPGDQESAVRTKAFQDTTVLFEDTIIADGLSHPLKEKSCSGWYKYSWSDTGKRLILESESSCPNEPPRKISGISFIDRLGEWLDIQLLQNQDERIITVRRYTLLAEANSASGQSLRSTQRARIASGTGFSINEIVELSKKVSSEVLEASLVEMHEPFKINSKMLLRLADADVPSPVIDLMVALSFPHQFYIERNTVSISERAGSSSSGSGNTTNYVYYSYYDPYFPWYWGPYTYSLYWGIGWGGWPGWYPPYPSYPPGYWPPEGSVPRNSGRLVAGQGYTRVNPRDSSSAQPRSAQRSSAGTRSSSRNSSAIYSGSGSSRGAASEGSRSSGNSGSTRSAAPPAGSGGSSYPSGGGSPPSGGGGYSGSSGGGSPSASPGGYSGGGGGHSAQPR